MHGAEEVSVTTLPAPVNPIQTVCSVFSYIYQFQYFCKTDSSSCLPSLLCISMLVSASIHDSPGFSHLFVSAENHSNQRISHLPTQRDRTSAMVLNLIRTTGKGFPGLAMSHSYWSFSQAVSQLGAQRFRQRSRHLLGTWRKEYKGLFWKCLAKLWPLCLWLLSALRVQAPGLALGKNLRSCLPPALGCEVKHQLELLQAKTMCQPPSVPSHHAQQWLWNNRAVNLCFLLFNCQLQNHYESHSQAFLNKHGDKRHSLNVLKKPKQKKTQMTTAILL